MNPSSRITGSFMLVLLTGISVLMLWACTSTAATGTQAASNPQGTPASAGATTGTTVNKTFTNPILTGMNPDPSICRVGDDFYLVTSTFEYHPGLPIYHSKDLVHWELIGHALNRPENNPLMGCESATGGNYAPTLRYNNGTFYIACTNYGGMGSRGVFYVTATNPAGPWSDPVWIGQWYVDPSMSFDDGVMYWLTPDNNGSFLLGIWDPVEQDWAREPQKIATGLGASSPEGPHLYKINGWYYLMSAEGGTGYQHREVIQRSKSPWGPYEASPINPVLSNKAKQRHPIQAIGHADLVQLQDGSWWAVCLGIRPVGGQYHHLGRETFLAPISWSAEGWPRVGETGLVEKEYPLPNLPEHTFAQKPSRDDFDAPLLDLAWNFVRNPNEEDWSLTERPGFLRIKGSHLNFETRDSPSFIGRRQSAFDMSASAKLDFTPTGASEEAGLVVRSTDPCHYDLVVTQAEGKRVAVLRKAGKDRTSIVASKELPGAGMVVLRVDSTAKEYSFFVQPEGQEASLLGTATTRDLSTEVAGGFTGVYIGMYASGNGSVNTNPADFDWFDFTTK